MSDPTDPDRRWHRRRAWIRVQVLATAAIAIATLNWVLTTIAVWWAYFPLLFERIRPGGRPTPRMENLLPSVGGAEPPPVPLFNAWLGRDLYFMSEAPLFALVCAGSALFLALTLLVVARGRRLGGIATLATLPVVALPVVLPARVTGILQHTVIGCTELPCRLDGRGLELTADELRVRMEGDEEGVRLVVDAGYPRIYPFCRRAGGIRVDGWGTQAGAVEPGGTQGSRCQVAFWPQLERPPGPSTPPTQSIRHDLWGEVVVVRGGPSPAALTVRPETAPDGRVGFRLAVDEGLGQARYDYVETEAAMGWQPVTDLHISAARMPRSDPTGFVAHPCAGLHDITLSLPKFGGPQVRLHAQVELPPLQATAGP